MGKKQFLKKDRKTQDITKQEAGFPPPSYAILVGIIIVITGAILIFSNLSNRYLWEDEAETALLGRNILTFGIPKAFDGKTLISQEVGRDYDVNYVWRWTPWLDKYITAASFMVQGEGTFPARFPFALLGLLSIVSLYFLANLFFKDRWMAVLSMAFLAFSVPFLLYVRQCRYYSIAILGSIWTVYFFFALLKKNKGAIPGFVIAMSLLFHSNYLTFLGTAFALMVCFLIFYFDTKVIRRVFLSYLLIFLINLPWFVFFNIMGKAEEAEKLMPFGKNLFQYYTLINEFGLPQIALLLFFILAAIFRKHNKFMNVIPARPFFFLLIFSMVYVIFISFAPWSFYRYVITLLPLFAILMAFMCRSLWSWNCTAAVLFSLCLLFTGVFQRISAYPFLDPAYLKAREERADWRFDIAFPLGNYLYEITHDLDGPIEGMVKFLQKNAKPNDRVFISYGDLPLKFYTKLEVKGGLTGEDLTEWPLPDWVIIRSFFRFGDREQLKQDAYKMGDYITHIFSRAQYKEVEIPYVDYWWENIPEPRLHVFRTPKEGQWVKIQQRVSMD